MAFSSCLSCDPLTFPQNLKHPSLFSPHKKLSNVVSFASTKNHEQLTVSPSEQEVIDILRTENDETAVLDAFNWALKQPSFEPSLSVFEEMLRKLGEVGSVDSIRGVLDDMKRSSCKVAEDTFFILIESFAKFGLYDEAVCVLFIMEEEFGVKPGTYSYNFLLNVLVDANKLKLVEDVHSLMSSKGVKQDVSTFNILIKALCKAHQMRPAVLMMEDMVTHGLVPDEKTYTTLMHGYIEEGNLNGALRIKEQMVSAQCQQTNITVNTLIHGYCKVGQVSEALNYVQKMSKDGFYPDRFTFNTLVNGLCKSSHVKHALELLDVMVHEGFDPDVYTYNTVISGLCKLGKVEDAKDILNQIFASSKMRWSRWIVFLAFGSRSEVIGEGNMLQNEVKIVYLFVPCSRI
ncbi:putative tetratricopeptide-like helical domain superfamily [Helianthus annuus]|nr:putative tetratricopeptide-like helical domain superfamily [Helianthus annuus]